MAGYERNHDQMIAAMTHANSKVNGTIQTTRWTMCKLSTKTSNTDSATNPTSLSTPVATGKKQCAKNAQIGVTLEAQVSATNQRLKPATPTWSTLSSGLKHQVNPMDAPKRCRVASNANAMIQCVDQVIRLDRDRGSREHLKQALGSITKSNNWLRTASDHLKEKIARDYK